ncbi:hypothetical protein Bca52824_032130 [Brassica carinata]|uniref:Uncharacterized protein n=1 Tax=Brassica carinata TaxID=52824 RepID=A0A8X7V5W9_BRACI|nr:hypothetical protein Bca52824_032130 [Brassica carinata]
MKTWRKKTRTTTTNNNEMEDADNSKELHQNGGATPDPGSGINEVMKDSGTRISNFPSVGSRLVIRPHASVTAVVAAERDFLIGESNGEGSLPSLENISLWTIVGID